MIQASRKEFLRVLGYLGNIDKSRSLPIIDDTVKIISNGNLKMQSTDLQLVVEAEIKTVNPYDWEGVLPAGKIKKILKAQKKDIVEIIPDKESKTEKRTQWNADTKALDEYEAVVDYHKASVNGVTVQGFDPEDYPVTDAGMELEWEGIIPLEPFLATLKEIAYARSVDERRFNLNAIYFHGKEKRIVATDGHRLALRNVDWLPDYNLCVPKRTILAMIKIFGDKFIRDGHGIAMMEIFKDNQGEMKALQFSIGWLKINSRLIYGEYPDYQKTIPLESSGVMLNALVNRERLLDAVNQVFAAHNERACGVTLNFSEKGLTLAYDYEGVGLSIPVYVCNWWDEAKLDQERKRAKLPKERDDVWWSMILNVCYFKEALEHLPWGELQFRVMREGGPVIFTNVNEGYNYEEVPSLHLIMPMRK